MFDEYRGRGLSQHVFGFFPDVSDRIPHLSLASALGPSYCTYLSHDNANATFVLFR